MKKTIKFIFLYLPAFFFVLYFTCPAAAFMPNWKPGDSWIVEVSYAQAFGPEKWSEPVYWIYRISDDKTQAQPGIILEARHKTDNALGLRVWLSGDLEPIKVQTFRNIRGEEKMMEIKPEPGFPVWIHYTRAPFDFPVFPLDVPSTETLTRIRPLSDTSELRVPEILKQESRVNDGIPEGYGFELQSGAGDIIEITVSSQEQETLFSQYWDKNLPWPLYGENKNMKYRWVKE
jgi:hypothetical protein